MQSESWNLSLIKKLSMLLTSIRGLFLNHKRIVFRVNLKPLIRSMLARWMAVEKLVFLHGCVIVFLGGSYIFSAVKFSITSLIATVLI